MNLTELITQWIGEIEQLPKGTQTKLLEKQAYYNLALKDLKSKIPDLIEQIEKEKQAQFICGRIEGLYEAKQVLLKTLNRVDHS